MTSDLTQIAGFTVDGVTVTIDWADGHRSPFHHLWLRDNCRCDACYHPHTLERLVDSMALALDITPTSVQSSTTCLSLTWPDGHVSVLASDFLREYCYSEEALAERRTPMRLWRGDELTENLPDYDYEVAMADDQGLAGFCDVLWSDGLVIVRGVPDTAEAMPALCHQISWMRETNFGVDFDVQAEIEPNNVAYTTIELDHHTDLPNREMPPGVQFLHCRRADAPGGASTLVDGFAAASVLALQNPEAHHLLATVGVPYEFHDADYDIRWCAPVIGLGPDGGYRDIRYHNALRAPLDVPSALVMPMYAALQAYASVLRGPGMALEFRMNPGDMIVFNNRRVLHGRRAFEPGGGRRHLHGAYVDIDELRSKMRVLSR